MVNNTEPKLKLLIGGYNNAENIVKKVVYNNYNCIDRVVPMQRCRGTIIDNTQAGKGIINITGWQRDITRIRKMDVSLPFIIKLTLENEKVSNLLLDESFNGGKGLLCSREYLGKRLKELIIGRPIDRAFLNIVKLENIHCFHISEILNSIYSSFFTLETVCKHMDADSGVLYEEEVSDCYAQDGNMNIVSLYQVKGREPLEYRLVFYDIFNRVAFSSDGYLRMVQDVKADFYMNGALEFTDALTQSKNDYIFIMLQKFLLNCVACLKKNTYPESKVRMMNTNLTPGAMVGIILQAVELRSFKDNFNYIQHVFTALQRPGKVPGCIGSILNNDEAKKYFPGFNYESIGG